MNDKIDSEPVVSVRNGATLLAGPDWASVSFQLDKNRRSNQLLPNPHGRDPR